MDFYNFDGPKSGLGGSVNLTEKLQNAVNSLEKRISSSKHINADSDSIQQVLNAVSDILENGFEGPEDPETGSSHYWVTLSSAFDTVPMRFVNSLEKFTTDSERAIVWILIELHKKNLFNVFSDIVKNLQVMQYYASKSVMKTNSTKVKEIVNKLSNLEYSIESKFLRGYEDNKDNFEQDSEDETPFVREMDKSHQTDYSQRTADTTQLSKSTTGVSQQTNQPLRRAVTNVDAVKKNLERYKNLLKRPTLVGRDDDDFPTFIREDYKKDLEEKNNNTPFAFISRVMEPVSNFKLMPPKMTRKRSSFDDLTKVGHAYKASKGHIGDFLDPGAAKTREPRRSSYDFTRPVDGPPDYSKMNGYYTTAGHDDQGMGYQTKKSEFRPNLGAYRASELRSMKNSRLLFIEKYQGLQAQYEYRSPPTRITTAEEQGNKCFECSKELNKLMLMVFPRKFFCQYTGYWYCGTCMAKQKMFIPWFVENFDFKLYHVCRKAREELKKFYDKANIMIDHKSKVVQDNKALYDTLLMKRQLHLIFDMICDPPLVLDLLGTNANLLLKQNLFSMKNLSEIHNGAMERYMNKCYEMLTSHITGCGVCQSKGKVCPGCNQLPKIFAFDIKNTSVCRGCKYLYHPRCLQLKKCIVCQHNS